MGMEEKNRKTQNSSDDLDCMLDAALAKYAAVEPRTGLEERILANLHAEQAKSPNRAWSQWSFAAAAVIVLIMAGVFIWKWSRPSNPPVVNRGPAVSQPQPQKPGQQQQATVNSPAQEARPRSMMRHSPELNAVAPVPKLDQFPSPQPLSAEEIALAQYVGNFPKEARLIAEAQEQFELETQKVMNDFRSENRPSGSTPQER